MKILSSEESRKADAYTIAHEPVKSVNLMERAAKACVNWMTSSTDIPLFLGRGARGEVAVFCGLGNNGGDGLAIARLLAAQKFKVEVYIIRHSDKCSPDFLANEKRLKKVRGVKIHNCQTVSALPSTFSSSAFIIDCLFGSGLNKPIEGLAAEAVRLINRSGCTVISIDIPSGLFADQPSPAKDAAIVRASHTLTFQSPKLAFMFPESGPYVGGFSVLDIGLDEAFISSLPSKNFMVREIEARFLYRKRSKFAHKGTYGHALIVAGSYGKMGACVLASRACLSSGAGLVTVHIPKCGYDILQTSNPEVMVAPSTGSGSPEYISGEIEVDKYTAIGIGPGIGSEKETQNTLKVLIQNTVRPLVLDADALNILAENKTWISFLPPNSILTPHPGEFRRLVGETDTGFERLQLQKDFSVKHGVYVVLKGAHTCITCPDGEVYFNSTGNPGMATAGSGDVLTGILTGLLAQGYEPKKACVLGVYLHGLAGDIAAQHLSEESLIARNIIEFLSEAYKKFNTSYLLSVNP